MAEIRTRRLLLRPARAEDATALFAVFSNPQAMRFWDTLPHASAGQTAKFLSGMIPADGRETRYFVIEHQGRPVGTGGFWRDTEVGYVLHPDLWGQGIGTELLQALIQFGFDTCGFDQLTAEVDPNNVASVAMVQKAGFVETGRAEKTLEIAGKWFDSVYFEMKRPG